MVDIYDLNFADKIKKSRRAIPFQIKKFDLKPRADSSLLIGLGLDQFNFFAKTISGGLISFKKINQSLPSLSSLTNICTKVFPLKEESLLFEILGSTGLSF